MSDAPVDVAAIREALAKATPGPWTNPETGMVMGTSGQGIVRRTWVFDAELIVLLRNNAKALLDELAMAEKVRDEWRNKARADWVDKVSARYARFQDDIETLREQLEDAKEDLERAQAASEGVDMLVAQAERRGAVKALRWAEAHAYCSHVTRRADDIENGGIV